MSSFPEPLGRNTALGLSDSRSIFVRVVGGARSLSTNHARCKWERVSALDGVSVRGRFDSLPSRLATQS